MRISLIHALGLLLFTLAWLNNDHYRPWMNFHSEMLAFAGLLGLLASVLLRARSLLVIPLVSVWVGLGSLVPWMQFILEISLFAGDALLAALYLSGLLAAIFVGYTFSRTAINHNNRELMGVMHCLWIAALVSAAIGLAQWLDVQNPLGMYVVQTEPGDRAMGNLAQPNQLATLLLMGMVAFSYIYESRVIGRFTFLLGIGFMTGGLILTQSRTGMLSVFVLTVFLLWKKRTGQARLSARAVAWWGMCFLLGALALPYISEAMLMHDVRDIGDAAPVNQRWQMWQQVAYAVVQSPWVGYGWNQTSTAHMAGAIAFPGAVTYTNAHNFVMDMLAWNGLPLGILVTGAIGYWFVSRMRASVRLEAVHAMACLLPLAVHSMLEYPFAYAYFLITAGLMVGVVEAAMVPVKTIALNVRCAWGFLAAWMAMGGYLTYEYFLIEEDFRMIRFENVRLGRTPATYEIPHVWMLSHLAAMLKAARQVAQPNMPMADLQNLRKVSQRFAYGTIHFRYALALGLNGDPVGASQQMAIIQGMFGHIYYTVCKEELRRLANERYPQLAAVVTP